MLETISTLLVALTYGVAGRLVIPRSRVGWVLALIGGLLALSALTDAYLDVADTPHGIAAWVDQIVGLVFLPSLIGIALPLTFPDGRLPGRRWRWVARVGATAVTLGFVGVAFSPDEIDGVENPLAIESDVIALADGLGSALLVASVIGAGAGLIVRLRRARGVERQQLKWFAFVVSATVGALAVATVLDAVGTIDVAVQLAGLVGLLGVAIGIPLATGFAILRYRLYDIDVVIRRTLIYGTLTASLGAAYLFSVLLLQLLLSPSSDLAIAGSTLAVAAIFQPLRRRIQALVDRRFYRRSYDAARTIAAFGARARDEVSLEALSDELRAVVTHTMQPAHVTVWLKRR